MDATSIIYIVIAVMVIILKVLKWMIDGESEMHNIVWVAMSILWLIMYNLK